MIDRTRLSVRAVLASALLLVVAAAARPPVLAADEASLIRLHAPCHAALAEELKASQRLRDDPSAEDATRTLAAVDAGLDWNEHACGPIASRSQQQNDVRAQMYLANKAFLYSLKGEAEQVLRRPSAAKSFAAAQPLLQQCASWSKLSADVSQRCTRQIGYNAAAQRSGRADTTDPCQVALKLTNDAGTMLKNGKDPASFETAYKNISDGLAANQQCKKHPQMHDVNQAYLLSYKVGADRALNIPFARDRDIPNAADPYAVPNKILNACKDWPANLPDDAAANCRKLLAINVAQPTASAQGYTPAGATAVHFDEIAPWPGQLRPGFVWDEPCNNAVNPVERKTCADERIHNGSGDSGWQDAPSKVATPLDASAERVLFATIRNTTDLNRLFDFGARAAPLPSDFFKSKILLVAAQRKPHQQCTMSIAPDGVKYVATPGTVGPSMRVYYTLDCDPPTEAPGNTVMKVVQVDSRNSYGPFADVLFIENGGEVGQTR